MKKQMKRTVYEAPVTERFQVELEGAIMGASIITGDQGVETTGHEINEIHAGNWTDENGIEHTGAGWNDTGWN